jgi:inorganic triphosphatase YgiF
MATETEIKLSLTPRAAIALATHPRLADTPPLRQRLLNTYYDTPALRLQRERVAVRYRKKGSEWLLTVKCAARSVGGLARRSEWEMPGVPGEFDFSHVDDAKLRHRLESWRAELTPAFTTHFTRMAWIIQPQTGVRIELALDRGWIAAQGRRQPICEIELELLDGEPDALFALASELQSALGDRYSLHPEAASKAERGYRLFANVPQQAIRARKIPLERGMTGVAAFQAIALACVGHLQDNEHGVRESDAPEFVHQARVAIRRLRSAIRSWKPLLPESFVDSFDARWQSLAAALGETRNWDVFLTETLPPLASSFPQHADIDHLLRHARKRRERCRKEALVALKSVAYSRLLLEFTAAVLALSDREKPVRIRTFARRCLDKHARRAAQLAECATGLDAASRHRLRVVLKRLRYALEFFEPLFPGQRQEQYYAEATRLQDLLGRLNDLVFARQIAVETLADREMGLVAGWIGGRNELLLGKFEEALTAFLELRKPWKKR